MRRGWKVSDGMILMEAGNIQAARSQAAVTQHTADEARAATPRDQEAIDHAEYFERSAAKQVRRLEDHRDNRFERQFGRRPFPGEADQIVAEAWKRVSDKLPPAD